MFHSFDGVLFDVFPLTVDELVDGESESFFPEAARLLRKGGVFTFYYDAADSWAGAQRAFRTEAAEKLRRAGFEAVEAGEVDVAPPDDCGYFWGSRFVVPVAVR